MGQWFMDAVITCPDQAKASDLSRMLRQCCATFNIRISSGIEDMVACLSRKTVSIAIVDLTFEGALTVTDMTLLRDHFPHCQFVVVYDENTQGLHMLTAAERLVTLPDWAIGTTEGQAMVAYAITPMHLPPNTFDLSHIVSEQKGASSAMLTRRQHAVVTLVAQGHSNKAIAATLDISENTVKAHLSSIMRVLGVRTRTAVAAAFLGQAIAAPVQRDQPQLIERRKGQDRRQKDRRSTSTAPRDRPDLTKLLHQDPEAELWVRKRV